MQDLPKYIVKILPLMKTVHVFLKGVNESGLAV